VEIEMSITPGAKAVIWGIVIAFFGTMYCGIVLFQNDGRWPEPQNLDCKQCEAL
jgi:hypothetical protein